MTNKLKWVFYPVYLLERVTRDEVRRFYAVIAGLFVALVGPFVVWAAVYLNAEFGSWGLTTGIVETKAKAQASAGSDSPLTWRTVYFNAHGQFHHGRFEVSVWLTHVQLWVKGDLVRATNPTWSYGPYVRAGILVFAGLVLWAAAWHVMNVMRYNNSGLDAVFGPRADARRNARWSRRDRHLGSPANLTDLRARLSLNATRRISRRRLTIAAQRLNKAYQTEWPLGQLFDCRKQAPLGDLNALFDKPDSDPDQRLAELAILALKQLRLIKRTGPSTLASTRAGSNGQGS
jgi:hypothetical protein